jgi:hypothetical protein
MSIQDKFIDALIKNLDYETLFHDLQSIKDIVRACLQVDGYKKLISELCNRNLIDSEMISEVIRPFNHSNLKFFPRHLIKPEHLLGNESSFPIYLKDYHDLMTPDLVKQLLVCNFNSLPYLPTEMISFEQVISLLKEYYPDIDIDQVKKLSIVEIVERHENYHNDSRRNDCYNELSINDYFKKDIM